MKKFTKTLSIVLLVAMCVSMFTVSSFAEPAHADGCAQTLTKVDKVEPTCTKTGMEEYWICPCGHVYGDAAGANYLSAMPVIPAEHKAVKSLDAIAATCTAGGYVARNYCEACSNYVDASGAIVSEDSLKTEALGHSWGDPVVVKPTVSADGSSTKKCTVCGVEDVETLPKLESLPFSVNGTSPVAFDIDNNFIYYVELPEVYSLKYIQVAGTTLYDNAYSYNSNSGKITIYGEEIAGIIGSKSSVELVFTADDDSTCGGFTINNKTTVETLTVDGFDQKGFIKGSTEAVAIRTNDVDSNNVRLYSFTDKNYVGITDMEFTKSGDMYTFTFTKAFLDTLDYGTYYVRCFYGENSYVSAGTIIISNSTATNNSSELKFTNSTVNSTEYKFVSGGTRPELYSQMFRDSAAKLQYSNDGYSWKDVSVYDYYIEQSGGKDTAYAWLKNSMLDNMKASSNVYFRVVVPASAAGTTSDIISNWVKVTTGNNIRAVDTDKHVINSSKSLKFTASTPVDVVKVGSIALVEGEDYAISKDKKTITLLADFLNKRTAGSTYTLTAITADGDEELKTTFKILTTAQASASPRTGDDSNIALWSVLVLMSGAAMVAVLPRLKKEQ